MGELLQNIKSHNHTLKFKVSNRARVWFNVLGA